MKSKEFYSVQAWVDGFGNDTTTLRCYETKEAAERFLQEYCKRTKTNPENYKIVRQRFAQDYIEYWD